MRRTAWRGRVATEEMAERWREQGRRERRRERHSYREGAQQTKVDETGEISFPAKMQCGRLLQKRLMKNSCNYE